MPALLLRDTMLSYACCCFVSGLHLPHAVDFLRSFIHLGGIPSAGQAGRIWEVFKHRAVLAWVPLDRMGVVAVSAPGGTESQRLEQSVPALVGSPSVLHRAGKPLKSCALQNLFNWFPLYRPLIQIPTLILFCTCSWPGLVLALPQ